MPEPITIPTEEDALLIGRDREIASLKGQLSEAKKTAARHLREAEEWEGRFEQLAAIKEPEPIKRLAPAASSGKDHPGVAFAVWSDWHVAEIVDASKVHRRNKYTPEIARKRSEICAANTVKVFRHVAKSNTVDTLFLFLGGDFITGYLHEELAQTNAMPPVEEARFAGKLLESALDQVVSEKGIKRLVVVCMRGNHGRTTRKMQFKNDYETSLESWIYWRIQDTFGKSAEIHVPKGDVVIVDAAKSFPVRCFHGHQVKYSDGIGGLTIPLNKWQAKQDSTQPARYNLMGHYHLYSLPNNRTLLNGSLKGWDEYAASKGFPYQDPLQGFAMMDVNRGMMSQHLPIFCT